MELNRKDIIDGYLMNEKHVIAEMLYDTITKYERQLLDLEFTFSCILDHATGGAASKPNISKEVAYQLIDKHVQSCIDFCVDEIKEELITCGSLR